MKANSLNKFDQGLEELRNYILFNVANNVFISSVQDSTTSSSKIKELIDRSTSFRRKKVFEYNSYIITLYGLFERFLENILSDYLNALCKIVKKFDDLPAQIRACNLELCTILLNSLSYPKYKHLSRNVIISNLHEAINNNTAILNIEAFQHHSYNFRSGVISEFFKNVGLGDVNGSLRHYNPLKSYLDDKYINHSNLSSDIVYGIINDLSDRRNDVSHGVETSDILNYNIVLDYIGFLEIYCNSLFRYLTDSLNEHHYLVTKANFSLINVFNNNVITGDIQDINVEIGDTLVFKKPKGHFPRYKKCKVQELEIDGESHKSVNAIKSTGVGIKINEKVKDNHEFKIIV